MKKRIVQFSGGLVSWQSAERVKAEFGTENMTLLFADTRMEDEDLYRFSAEAAAHIGVPITVIADGRTPWDVFFAEGMMGNAHVDLCSRILKRELLDKWRKANTLPEDSVIYVGLSWDEANRYEGVKDRLHPWLTLAPMMRPPFYTKPELEHLAREAGIEPPRLYGMGFPHNNCGGFCIKAGQTQFALLLRTMPERYAFHEEQEERFRALHGDVSILRDRRGGTTKPLSLKALRERIEGGAQPELFDWGGCGCGV